MKKENTIQIVIGVGIGTLVFGIFLFAQRPVDFLSFEKFRAPQFSVRNPSEEDRPMVEVISTNSTESPSSKIPLNESPTEVPLSSEPESLPSESPAEVSSHSADLNSEKVPSVAKRSLDHLSISDHQDRRQMELQFSEKFSERSQDLVETRNEFNLRGDFNLSIDSFGALSFSDRSVNQLFLRSEILQPMRRQIEVNAPPVSPIKPETYAFKSAKESEVNGGNFSSVKFRETALGLVEEGAAARLSEKRANQNQMNTWGQGAPFLAEGNGEGQPDKFKDYTQREGENGVKELSEEEQALAKKKEILKSEEDPGALLAKKNEEAKVIQNSPVEDRRFRSVEQRNNLFADDGARLYAPGIKVGRFDVRLDLQNQISYTDNYQTLPKFRGKAIDGATTANAAPSLEVAAGERDSEVTDVLYLAFRYTPTITSFLDIDKKEIVDHSVAFNSGFRFSKLALVVDQRITPYSGGDIEAGSFISRNFYVTTVSAEYEVSDKTSIELGLGNSIRDYKDGFDSQDTSIRGYANYSMSEKIRLGLGAGYGHVTSTGGPDQDYQQALVRGLYFATAKTTLFAETGYEQRQFKSKVEDQNSIVFKAGGSLALFPKTTLAVNASRNQIPSSVIRNANTGSTGFNGSISQLVYKFKLGVGGGYEVIEFSKASTGTPKISSFPYYNYSLTAAYPITDWWDVGLSYTHRFTDKKKDALGRNNDIESNETSLSSRIKF